MAINITASGAQSIGLAKAILIEVDLGYTGSLIVTAAGSSQYGTVSQTLATITNPVTGQLLKYGGLHGQGAISINPSTATDLAITKVNHIS